MAHKHIEKKWQEQKAKEEEEWKAEEEEVWKWKEEEDKVIREKARKRQLVVSSSTSFGLLETDQFQMLQKQKEARKAQWVDIDGVGTGNLVSGIQN